MKNATGEIRRIIIIISLGVRALLILARKLHDVSCPMWEWIEGGRREERMEGRVQDRAAERKTYDDGPTSYDKNVKG